MHMEQLFLISWNKMIPEQQWASGFLGVKRTTVSYSLWGEFHGDAPGELLLKKNKAPPSSPQTVSRITWVLLLRVVICIREAVTSC